MGNKKSKPIQNKKKKNLKDITIELDKFTGRIPTAKGNIYFKNKKYDKKGNRKRTKLNLKKYIG